ncbi:MFS transporter [Yinghuangia seranimata]|uniref:MFS transporter n=1 Tax=Yinghuangia seranimata TaxID=408067 RepID=UPI00248BB255|nr:MFS transporter [Yinghuangia seranimata]MDI2131248.1 MFS transporter [Yinghuangia seranimata]
MFSSLRVRNYRLFAAGQAVSNSGTWMQRLAQDWLVLKLTGSTMALGITTGLQFLPMLLFGLWGGAIADRYPKRRLLIATQTVMGLLAAVLAVLDLAGVVQVWHVWLLAVGLGLATAVDNPTRQSFVVEMVGRRDLPNAVSLNSANFQLGRIAGPALAGVLIAAIGTGWVFAVNALSFVAVILGLLAMRERELRPVEPVKREPGQLREALRYVRARPDLLATFALIGFIGTFGFNFAVTIGGFANQVFHAGPGAFGLLNTVFAVGSLGGALWAARRGRSRMRMLIGAALTFGLLSVLASVMPAYWAFALMLIPIGVAGITFNTAANSSVQLSVDAALRGRVMGLYMLVFMGGTPFGGPLVGWIAQAYGPRAALFFGGAVSAAAAVVVGLLLARHKRMRVRFAVRPHPAVRLVDASAGKSPARQPDPVPA